MTHYVVLHDRATAASRRPARRTRTARPAAARRSAARRATALGPGGRGGAAAGGLMAHGWGRRARRFRFGGSTLPCRAAGVKGRADPRAPAARLHAIPRARGCVGRGRRRCERSAARAVRRWGPPRKPGDAPRKPGDAPRKPGDAWPTMISPRVCFASPRVCFARRAPRAARVDLSTVQVRRLGLGRRERARGHRRLGARRRGAAAAALHLRAAQPARAPGSGMEGNAMAVQWQSAMQWQCKEQGD